MVIIFAKIAELENLCVHKGKEKEPTTRDIAQMLSYLTPKHLLGLEALSLLLRNPNVV